MEVHHADNRSCGHGFGKGRWWGPLHMCNLPYIHDGRHKCRCGTEDHSGENVSYSMAGVRRGDGHGN